MLTFCPWRKFSLSTMYVAVKCTLKLAFYNESDTNTEVSQRLCSQTCRANISLISSLTTANKIYQRLLFQKIDGAVYLFKMLFFVYFIHQLSNSVNSVFYSCFPVLMTLALAVDELLLSQVNINSNLIRIISYMEDRPWLRFPHAVRVTQGITRPLTNEGAYEKGALHSTSNIALIKRELKSVGEASFPLVKKGQKIQKRSWEKRIRAIFTHR